MAANTVEGAAATFPIKVVQARGGLIGHPEPGES